MAIEINGSRLDQTVTFPPTGSWTAWSQVKIPVPVTAGTNAVRLIAIGESGPNLDTLAIVRPVTVNFQAEDLASANSPIMQNHPGAQVGRFIDMRDASSVTLTVNAETASAAQFDIRDAMGNAPRSVAVEVNGDIADPAFQFPSTANWRDWQIASLTLNFQAGGQHGSHDRQRPGAKPRQYQRHRRTVGNIHQGRLADFTG